jgi:hypothetical protein
MPYDFADQAYTPDDQPEQPLYGEMTTEDLDNGGKLYSGQAVYQFSPTQRFVAFRNDALCGFDAEASIGHKLGLINFSIFHVFGGERGDYPAEICAPAEAFEAIVDMLDAVLDEDASSIRTI